MVQRGIEEQADRTLLHYLRIVLCMWTRDKRFIRAYKKYSNSYIRTWHNTSS